MRLVRELRLVGDHRRTDNFVSMLAAVPCGKLPGSHAALRIFKVHEPLAILGSDEFTSLQRLTVANTQSVPF